MTPEKCRCGCEKHWHEEKNGAANNDLRSLRNSSDGIEAGDDQ
jgi:hypothetical protein